MVKPSIIAMSLLLAWVLAVAMPLANASASMPHAFGNTVWQPGFNQAPPAVQASPAPTAPTAPGLPFYWRLMQATKHNDATAATEPSPPVKPTPPTPSILEQAQSQALRRSLLGQWTASVGSQRLEITFYDNGKYKFGTNHGDFAVQNGRLILHSPTGEETYNMTLASDQLTLTGGGLAGNVLFGRQFRFSNYFHSLTSGSAWSQARKVAHILNIVFIVIIARLAILILGKISDLVILSDWGFFGVFYRYRKNRAKTIHSLVLNLIKYVIYFTAIGYILSTLGVNYTAYLASLSVIGLAIGFGSQGLVQDMVTGFFIIFEGQYDVGDMVEISGQTGLVEQIGLRMTQLRNYLGEIVTIPNRNIAVVGNFYEGSQHVQVDVAIGEPAAAPKPDPQLSFYPEEPAEPSPDPVVHGKELLMMLGEQLAKQYQGVVTEAPAVTGPLSLTTGEKFLRLKMSIWPGQTWIVDQQLLPRVRELFKRDKLEIPNDRIAVFYFGQELQTMPLHKLRQSLRKLRNVPLPRRRRRVKK